MRKDLDAIQATLNAIQATLNDGYDGIRAMILLSRMSEDDLCGVALNEGGLKTKANIWKASHRLLGKLATLTECPKVLVRHFASRRFRDEVLRLFGEMHEVGDGAFLRADIERIQTSMAAILRAMDRVEANTHEESEG